MGSWIGRATSMAAAGILVVLAAVAASGFSVAARSEVIDEVVRRMAAPLGMVFPASRVSALRPGGAGMEYPVIERIPLRGHTNAATGEPVPALEIWRQDTLEPDRVVPMALLLVLAGALHAGMAVSWAWPRAIPGHRIDRTRFSRLALAVATWSSPVAVMALSAYWPLVSLWGTAAYECADRRGVAAWIADTPATRAMIGAGLALGYSSVSLGVARTLLNIMLRRGSLAQVEAPPTIGVCLACGYSVCAGMERCPECGEAVGITRPVVFIWPRVLGAPTRRRRHVARTLLAVLAIGMVAAPLLVGVLRGAVGAVH